jgi:hypothetical protein
MIFLIQNTHTVQVTFLGLTGSTSLALMLLIAAVGGILLILILGSARILQLRHTGPHTPLKGPGRGPGETALAHACAPGRVSPRTQDAGRPGPLRPG